MFKKLYNFKNDKLDEIRFKCKNGNSYDIKNTYLEHNIEELTAFFDSMDIQSRKFYLSSYEDSFKDNLKEKLLKMEMSRQKKL